MSNAVEEYGIGLEQAAGMQAERLLKEKPGQVYRALLDLVEKPMLEVAMLNEAGNQSAAAEALGINRATLRVKLKRHGML